MEMKNNLLENDTRENIFEIKDDNQYIMIYIKAFIRRNFFKIKLPFQIIGLIFFCILILFPVKEKTIAKDAEVPYFVNKGYSEYLSKEMVSKFNNYMDICHQSILMDNKTYNLTKTPKISVIMALYNGGKFLHYSLRSIQNQDFKDIEIILIDDQSTDDTVEIVNTYMKEDPRIRLIKNERNRRILYSKSLAALYSNGEYIIEIDQDDMFIIDNAFSLLYYEAKKSNFDLVQFQDFFVKEFHLRSPVKVGSCQLIFHNQDTSLKQPEIKNGFFNEFNYLLWGLLIKADIYKKAIHTIWPIIINYKIVHFEDYHITFLLAAYAKSFRFFNYYFLLHLFSQNSAGSSQEFGKEMITSQIFFINNMLDYHIKDHPDDVLLIFNLLNYMKDHEKNISKMYHDNNFFKYVMLKAFRYLSYEQKIYFKKNLKFNNLKINDTYEYFTNKEEFNSILSYQNLISSKSKKHIKNINLPKFSIIIYSAESELLNKTLNSIQNQNYDNFEIILICDFCENLEEINNLIEDYINIQLISYPQQKGLLYSYSEAILKSKGDYILTVESGYTLSTSDVLYKLNEYINNNTDDEVDIFEFNLLVNTKNYIDDNSLILYKCSHFESEFELELGSRNSSMKYNPDFKNLDQEKELLVNKLIKSDVYQSIIRKIFLLYKDNIIINYFDEIIFYLFNQNKIKSKNVNFTGIIKYQKILNASDEHNNDINNKVQLIKDSIFYINFLFDNSPNKEKDKLLALNEFYNLMPTIFGNNNLCNENGKKLIYKFLNSEFIPQYNKNILKFYYNALINRDKCDLIN